MKLLFTFLLSISTLFAGLNITEVNTKEFPKNKASLSVTDGNGIPITDFDISDFTIIENGIDLTPSATLTCKEDDIQEASILLILDASGSMDEETENGITRWEWAVEGAINFVEQLEFEGRTQVGITTFSNFTTKILDFTNDKEALIDSLESLKPGVGNTSYISAFLERFDGAYDMFEKTPQDLKRVCVFLTDGIPTNGESGIDEILPKMKERNIAVYNIAFLVPTGGSAIRDLIEIAQETGGKFFEVFEAEYISTIYQLISFDIQSKSICDLSWISPLECDPNDLERSVEFLFIPDPEKIPEVRTYDVPDQGIVSFDISSNPVLFGSPEANSSSTATLRIVNTVAPLRLDGYSIIPTEYFDIEEIYVNGELSNIGAQLEINDTLDLVMEFTQGDTKTFRQALLTLEGDFCAPSVDLIGGFSTVNIINPKGGETYLDCDRITIDWVGNEGDVPVDVFYNRDKNGWVKINNQPLVGNSINFNPPEEGNYLFRVTRPQQRAYTLINQLDSPGDVFASDIMVDENGTFFYHAANFEEEININGQNKLSIGLFDAAISKFDRDGNTVWNRYIEGTGIDSISGMDFLPNGNIVICGTAEKGARFNGQNLPFMEYTGLPYGFVAIIDADGNLEESYVIGARDNQNSSRLWAEGVRYVEDNNELLVVCKYLNSITRDILGGGPDNLNYNGNGTTPQNGRILLDLDLNPLDLNGPSNWNPNDFTNFTATDPEGNIYQTNSYNTNTMIGNTQFTPTSGYDGVITKNTLISESSDQTSAPVRVFEAIVQFATNNLDMGEVFLGNSGSKLFSAQVNNPTLLPIALNGFDFTNNDNNEFQLVGQLPDEITAGESIDLEFEFNPADLENRSSTFNIYPDCASDISLVISGIGACAGESIEEFTVNQSIVNIRTSTIIQDVFTNPTTRVLEIAPIITNDANGEFEVFVLDNGTENTNFNVPGGETIDCIVYFTPQSEGEKTAVIDFGITEICYNTTTDISGIGINSEIFANVASITNRIETVNNRTLAITNGTEESISIQSIEILTDADNGVYSLTNPNDTYQLDAVGSGNNEAFVPFVFYPTQEGEYSASFSITDNSGNIITTSVDDLATNPRLSFEFDCPQNTRQNETGQATLTIRNESQFEDARNVQINSLVSEFSIDPADQIINQITFGNPVEINIEFNPQNTFADAASFEITSNTEIGNGSDDQVPDSKTEIFTNSVECTIVPSGSIPPIDFGNVLVCDAFVNYSYSFQNNNPDEDLVIQSPNINSPVFSTDFPGNEVSISPNDELIVNVTFDPNDVGDYTEEIEFENNQDLPLTFEFKGTGVNAVYNIEGEFEVDNFDTPYPISIVLNIPELTTTNGDLVADNEIDEVNLRINYNSNVIQFEDQNITDELNWNNFQIIPGNNSTELILSGSGQDITTPYSGTITNLSYKAYFGDDLSPEISINEVFENCQANDNNPITIEITETCIERFQLINVSETGFNLKAPEPNPGSELIKLGLDVPYEMESKMTIYDVNGNKISQLTDGILKEGKYKFEFDASRLESGVYYIVFESFTFNETKPIYIIK